MTRRELHRLSRLRQREARLLLRADQYAGAYYLIGYSVECALKACIAKQIRQFEFPDKDLASRAYSHQPQELLKLAGLEDRLKQDMNKTTALALSWAVVKDWSVKSRYDSSIG